MSPKSSIFAVSRALAVQISSGFDAELMYYVKQKQKKYALQEYIKLLKSNG